jgi:hypothetical protein
MLSFSKTVLAACGLALVMPGAGLAQDQAEPAPAPAPEAAPAPAPEAAPAPAPAAPPAEPAEEEFLLDEAPAAPAEVPAEITAVLDQMDQVVKALDAKAERTGNSWQFTLEGRNLLVVTDTNALRMRIITPIALVAELPEDAMERLLQANFDTALDARYAVAQNIVWGAFIHPLDTLTTRDFAAGILQTLSVGETFGTTFSSGAISYGGGDSGAIYEEQLKALLEEIERNSST